MSWKKRQVGTSIKAGWAAHGNKIMGITILALVGLTIFGFASLTTPPPENEGGPFEAIAWDGGRGIKLPAASFDWDLYGIKGTNLNDFGEFDLLVSGTSLSDLGASDFDTDYDTFVVKASGEVQKSWWDTDDPMVENIDTKYDHLYYARWFVLTTTGNNYLIFYETASAAGFIVIDTAEVTPITAAPIADQTNFTVIAFVNGSQPFARYVVGPNFANENNDMPEFILDFSAAVDLSDINCQGATKSRENNTAIKFTFGVLSATPSVFKFIWDDDAPTINIDTIYMMFGDTKLAKLV